MAQQSNVNQDQGMKEHEGNLNANYKQTQVFKPPEKRIGPTKTIFLILIYTIDMAIWMSNFDVDQMSSKLPQSTLSVISLAKSFLF